jgi:hypothetical protein
MEYTLGIADDGFAEHEIDSCERTQLTASLDRPPSTTNIPVNFLRAECRILSMRIAQVRIEHRQSRLGGRGGASRSVDVKRAGGRKS